MDVLVNNAGIFDVKPFDETDLGLWNRMVEVNLKLAELYRQLLDLDAEISGRDSRLEGSLRVSSTTLMLRHFMPD